MIETWIEIGTKANRCDSVVAFSNTGLMRLKNGEIKEIPLRRAIYYNGRLKLLSIIIAETFIPNPENKPQVDHKTHDRSKIDYALNDIRNLRWCTNKENANFDECKEKQRKAKLGRKLTEEHKKHIGEATKGKEYTKYWSGKKMSDTTKKKMSESAKTGWLKRKNKKAQENS